MARLVLINGAPGSGKSTLARRYAEDHPLVLALDVDTVRGMLGGWLDQPAPAGMIARRLALAMARVQLGEGRDVVVPQYLGRLGFVLELEELCRQVGAQFVEVVLVSDPPDAARRFARRSATSGTAEHRGRLGAAGARRRPRGAARDVRPAARGPRRPAANAHRGHGRRAGGAGVPGPPRPPR